MKKAKKLLSLFLAVIMLYSVMSVGMGGLVSFAAAGDSVTIAGTSSTTYNRVDDVIICVPETIYMTPSTGASVSGQYFVNNIVDSSGKVTLATDYADTTGQISIYAPGATAFSISVSPSVGSIGDPIIGSAASSSTTSHEDITWNFADLGGSTGFVSFDGLYLYINGTGLSAGSMASIIWAITLTYSTGTVTYYVYSTLYSPYYVPVGAATRAQTGKNGSKVYTQSIAWVSGVHGFTANSDDSKYWVATTNETLSNESADVETRGTYYAKTSSQAMVPLIYGVGDTGKTTSAATDWLSASSSSSTLSVPSFRYFSFTSDSGKYGCMVVDISPVANLTVDTSRYTNLNQIPNLTVGFNVTDTENSSGVYWYASDYTSVAHSQSSANNGTTNFYNWTKQASADDITDYESKWFNSSSTGSIYVGSASGTTSYSSGVEYNSSWNRSIVTGSSTYDYMFKGAAHGYASKGRAYSINYVQLRVTNTDKSALRKLVLQCSSINKANYSYGWDWFIQAYQNAAYVLGNPCATASDISTAISRLNTAISGGTDSALGTCSGLQIDVNFNANGGSVSSSSQRVTIGTNTTVSVTPPTATRTGYTFKGWATSSSATSGSTSSPLSVSLYGRNLYATWSANSYNLVYDNLFDFSKFTISTGALTINERTETGFTVTSTSGTDANTGFSYAIPVEAGKTYILSADVEIERADSDTKGFDIYINTLDSSLAGESTATVDTTNGAHKEGNVYISLTGQKVNTNGAYIKFTAGDSTAYVKIRFDANTLGNKLTVNNIRLYEVGTVADGVSWHAPKTVTYDSTYGELPTPTRPGYTFQGWYGADGTTGYWSTDKVIITSDTSVYSKWKANEYTVTFEQNYGDYSSTQTKYTPDDTVTVPTLTRTGYTLDGWKVTTADGNWSGTYTAGDKLTGMYGSAILTAQWSINNYTITYDANGGSCSESTKSYTIEDTVTIPAPTRTGYTFNGWKVTSGTTGNWTAGTYNAGNVSSMYGDVTLTAQWTADPFTITFVDWDGTVIQQSDFDYDSTPVPPADPTRDADNGYTYTFAGWNPAVDKVTGEATYTATYTANLIPYTITLDAGEGTVSSDSVAYNYESTSVTLPDATRTGYTFDGWTVKESVGSWTDTSTLLKGATDLANAYGNVTLVANYTANEYTVTLDLNDSEYVGTALNENNSSFKVTYDSTFADFALDSDITRNGYNFIGWYTVADRDQISDANKFDSTATYTTADNITVYAHYEAIEYTLTLNNYDSATNTYSSGTKSTMTYTVEDDLTLPTPAGTYDTMYWKTGISVNGSWEKQTEYVGNLGTGCYGSVTLNLNLTCTITWADEDGTVLETDTGVTFGSTPTFNGTTPAKDPDAQYSYEFAGWSPEVTAATGSVTYKATYKSTDRVYIVTWKNSDGTVLETDEVYYEGVAAYDGATPTKDATAQYTYTFAGWKDEQGNDFVAGTQVTADVTYIADYTATTNEYKITWIIDGAETSEYVEYGKTPTHADPTKAADAEYTYKFSGWSPAITSVTGTATYTAVFDKTPNKYTVTLYYYADEAALTSGTYSTYTHTFAYGDTITGLEDAPEITGYAVAWETNLNNTTMPAENVDVYAKYERGCVVTWVVDGQSSKTAHKQGDSITAPADPTKAADAEYTYTFSHWEDKDGNEVTFPVTADQTDRTYTAVFDKTPNKYTVNWIADGNTVYTETVAYGSAVPTNDVPAKTGYTGEWDTVPATMPAEDVTITAVYEANTYTVTWVIDGAEDKTYVTYGNVPTYADPTKASTAEFEYTFKGWATSENGDVLSALPTVAANNDTVYYAVFEATKRSYEITWIIDGEKEYTYVEYGETPTHADAKKASTAEFEYTFAGWLPAIEAVTGEATYTADFVAIRRSYTIKWVTGTGTYTGSWEYGSTPDPVKDGVDTSKPATAEKEYTFTGWDKEISTVTGAMTYTALYSEEARSYTVTYIVDGKTYDEQTVKFGSNFSHPEIPAVEGYNGVWSTEYMTMPAQPITITAVYTAKKYTVTWVDDNGNTVYTEQVAYGSAIPAKAVPAKVGHTGTWGTYPETMPATEVTIKASYTANNYIVTWKFTSGSGTDTATYGVDYEVTFNLNPLPGDVRVTVNGVVLSNDSYTYDYETGTLFITGTAITGAVSITEKAAEGYQNVVISVANATLSNTSTIVGEGQAYHTTIIPNEGYALPDSIIVYIDGVELYTGYTYDSSTGKLTVNAEVMTGELTISVDCPTDPNYNGTSEKDCTCNCHSTNAFVKFFWKIGNFFRRLFGMTKYRYCDCGTAHW